MPFRWNLNVGDHRIGGLGARIIADMDDDDWKETMRGIKYEDYWPRNRLIFTFDETDIRPRAFRVIGEGRDLWFIRGAYTLSHARVMIRGYLTPRVAEDNVWWNLAMWQAAIGMMNHEVSEGRPLNPTATFFGHSFGGGIAACMGQAYRQSFPGCIPRVFTYGMPRTYVVGDPDGRGWPAMARYYNVGDSVARLCPLANEAAVAHFLLPGSLSAQLNLFRHIGVPYKCTTEAEPVIEELPRLASLTVAPDIGQWMEAVMAGRTNEHSILTYAININRFVSVDELATGMEAEGVQVDPPPVSGGGVVLAPAMQPLPPAEVQALIIQAQREQAVQAQTWAGQVVQRYFVPRRRSRVWTVMNGERTIRLCTTKRKCRSFCKRGNRLVSEIRARGGTDFGSAETAVAAMV